MLKQLVLRLLFLLPIYCLLRAGFYFYHLNTYQLFSTTSILYSFIYGLRFDIAAIFWSSSPLILLSVIPFKSKILEFVKSLFYVVTTTLVILASLDDYELIQFMGKRLSQDLFVIGGDIWSQLPQLITYYWYFPLLTVLVALGLWKFDKKYFRPLSKMPSSLIIHTQLSLLILVITAFAIRGGIQKKPLSVQSAFTQGEHELGNLVLNTPYHFLRTLGNETIKPLQYMSEAGVLSLIKRVDPNYEGIKNANIVILILESFSEEYFEKGYMPFLKELKSKSIFFPHHMANGRRSIEALPAIFNSLPSLLSEPISKSNFQSNQFFGLGHALKKAGYTNYFFHGGFRGTMSFDAYILSNGFDKYFAREDYPDQKDFDGNWGIYDGPFLKYSLKVMDEMPTPFMVGLFTLSSHQPYSIPEEWRGKFPKGNLEIHESVGYVDQMLREYFEIASTKEWFKNTLFVITADHTQKLEDQKFNNTVGRFRVPLFLYSPTHQWKKINTSQISQHADIPKTVLDFVQIKSERLPLTGHSLLGTSAGVGIYRDNAEFGLITGQKLYRLQENTSQVSQYNWETGTESSAKKDDALLLKAYLQYFTNSLINNSLSSEKIVTE